MSSDELTTKPDIKPKDAGKFIQATGLLQYDNPTTWDLLWQKNVTPWVRRTYHPALQEAIEDTEVNYPSGSDKRALIPGCGEGHDVIYLASTLGLHSIGLDISPLAIERATSFVDAASDIPKGLVEFTTQDFFTLKPESDEYKFDLVYDFTFFVAIHPSQRPEWGKQMSALIKPGGYLITLVFPIDPKVEVGPPWYVRPDHYDEPLGENFKKVLDRAPTKFPQGEREGRQHLLVWQRI